MTKPGYEGLTIKVPEQSEAEKLLGARVSNFVETYAVEVPHDDREWEAVMLGYHNVAPQGPITFDGVAIMRRYFIDPRTLEDDLYFSDVIRLTDHSSIVYEITYDHVAGFSQLSVGGGADLHEVKDDTLANRLRAAERLLDWLEAPTTELFTPPELPDVFLLR